MTTNGTTRTQGTAMYLHDARKRSVTIEEGFEAGCEQCSPKDPNPLTVVQTCKPGLKIRNPDAVEANICAEAFFTNIYIYIYNLVLV